VRKVLTDDLNMCKIAPNISAARKKIRKSESVNFKMVPAFSARSKQIRRIEMCSDEQNCYNITTFWRIIVICGETWVSSNSNEEQKVRGVVED
jgi:hypothetical protein